MGDPRLKILEAAVKRTHLRKEVAFSELLRAHDELASSRDVVKAAERVKVTAEQAVTEAIANVAATYERNQPQIRDLDRQRGSIVKKMDRASKRADAARRKRHISASEYYDQKANLLLRKSRALSNDIHRLIKENTTAEEVRAAAIGRLDSANADLRDSRSQLNRSRSLLESATVRFNKADADYERALAAYNQRSAELQLEQEHGNPEECG